MAPAEADKAEAVEPSATGSVDINNERNDAAEETVEAFSDNGAPVIPINSCKQISTTAQKDGEDGKDPNATQAKPAQDGAVAETEATETAQADTNSPLPTDTAPTDDGWQALWDPLNQAWYFLHGPSGKTQWENPRVPEATQNTVGHLAVGYGRDGLERPSDWRTLWQNSWSADWYQDAANPTEPAAAEGSAPAIKGPAGRYNPAIHGSWDPNADYAREVRAAEDAQDPTPNIDTEIARNIIGAAHFNRVTGQFQTSDENKHSDEAKSKRQMEAFFNVDVAGNSHDGRSLKAERRNKKLSRDELKKFQEKKRKKKEERRRAWLRD